MCTIISFLQSLVVGMFREGGRKDARMSLSLLLVSLRDSRLGSTSVAGKSALGLLLLFTFQCITFERGGRLFNSKNMLGATEGRWFDLVV